MTGRLVIAQEVMRTGQEQSGELRHLTTFGKDVWLGCTMSRFIQRGKYFMHLVVQDITARKMMEVALKENDEMLRLFIENSPADYYKWG